jgi:hypothetical protein
MLNNINELVNNTNFENPEAINYLKSLEVKAIGLRNYYMDDSLPCGEYVIEYTDGNTQDVNILYNEDWNPIMSQLLDDSDVDATELAHLLYNWLDENIDNVLMDIQAETEAEFRDELITGGYHPQLIEMFIKVYNEEEVEA